jgi:hypothetical protein
METYSLMQVTWIKVRATNSRSTGPTIPYNHIFIAPLQSDIMDIIFPTINKQPYSGEVITLYAKARLFQRPRLSSENADSDASAANGTSFLHLYLNLNCRHVKHVTQCSILRFLITDSLTMNTTLF